MKRYISRAVRPLGIAAWGFGAVLMAGIVLLCADVGNFWLSVAVTVVGGFFCILFIGCYFAEKSRFLTIDADKITLPRGAEVNGKTVFSRTVIRRDQIRSVESELHKGDGLLVKDTCFHTLHLTDGQKVTFPLYAYGREAGQEILEAIRAA